MIGLFRFHKALLCIIYLTFRFETSASIVVTARINGTTVYITDDNAENSNIDSECHQKYGTTYQEYEPGTNAEVEAVIEALHNKKITINIWIKIRTDPYIEGETSYSWKYEQVASDLWFRDESFEHKEPDDLLATVMLRKTYINKLSITGKHMLGDRGFNYASAGFMCVVSPTLTTTLRTTTSTSLYASSNNLFDTTSSNLQTTTSNNPLITTANNSTESSNTNITLGITSSTTPNTTSNISITTRANSTIDTSDNTTNTTSNNPLETKSKNPLETTSNNPLETTPDIPLESTSNNPLETKSNNPLETTPDIPLQTTPDILVETTNHIPVKTVSNNSICTCRCPYNTSIYINVSLDRINQLTNILTQGLTLNYRELSKHIRKLTSAPDNRLTSQIAGVTGVIILVFTFGLMALSDIVNIFRRKSEQPLHLKSKD